MTEPAPATPAPAAGAFSARVVAILVAVGVLGFAAFIVLSAFASDLSPPEQPGEHAQSRSAIGFAGLVRLLASEGRPVHLHRGKVSELGYDGLVVLSPPLGEMIDRAMLDGLKSNALVVLPKWRVQPDPRVDGWVRQEGVASALVVEIALRELQPSLQVRQALFAQTVELATTDAPRSLDHLRPVRIDRLQTISPDNDFIKPLLTDANGDIILGTTFLRDQNVTLYILSDPDFLNTHGLADAATAEAGVAIIDALVSHPTSPVTFDMTLHGVERSRNLMKLMLEPPFLPATLCLVFAAVLVGLHAAIVRRIPRRAKRGLGAGAVALVENSALLVTQAGKELGMGRRYAAMTRALTTTHVGGASGLGEAEQVELLDAVARSRGRESFGDLAAAIAAARKPAELMAAARRLYNWKQELARDRRRG